MAIGVEGDGSPGPDQDTEQGKTGQPSSKGSVVPSSLACKHC